MWGRRDEGKYNEYIYNLANQIIMTSVNLTENLRVSKSELENLTYEKIKDNWQTIAQEHMLVYLHLADRHAFSLSLGKKKAQVLENLVYVTMVIMADMLKYKEHEAESFYSRFLEMFNERSAEYTKHATSKNLNKQTLDTIFWIFGGKVSKLLCGRGNNKLTAIASSQGSEGVLDINLLGELKKIKGVC